MERCLRDALKAGARVGSTSSAASTGSDATCDEEIWRAERRVGVIKALIRRAKWKSRIEVNHQRTRTLGLRLRRAQRPAGHVHTLIEAGRLDVALDLSGVTFADSTVVGEIASTHIALHRRGGRLTLLNPSKRMGLLRSISRLASVIEIRPTA